MRPGEELSSLRISLLPLLPPIGRTGHSLARFGTVAFGIEMMSDLIELRCNSFELGTWMSFVPPVYRAGVIPIVSDVFRERHHGQMASAEQLYVFVEDLNREIFDKLVPIAPSG